MNALMMVVVLFSLVGVATLSLTLRRVTNQLVKTNRDLLVMFASWKIGPGAARALVSMEKPPQSPIPGVATAKEKKKEGIEVVYGLGGLER